MWRGRARAGEEGGGDRWKQNATELTAHWEGRESGGSGGETGREELVDPSSPLPDQLLLQDWSLSLFPAGPSLCPLSHFAVWNRRKNWRAASAAGDTCDRNWKKASGAVSETVTTCLETEQKQWWWGDWAMWNNNRECGWATWSDAQGEREEKKRGQPKDELPHLTPKNTPTSGSRRIQQHSGASCSAPLLFFTPWSYFQRCSLRDARGQGQGTKKVKLLKKKKKKGQENIFHGLELEVQPAANRSVWAHTTNIQASGHGVCVSHLVIVLHPNRAGWRKVPFLEASDCCSCLLVARLPGIDKAAPTSTHTFLLPHFSFSLLWDFPGKTKLHVVLRQSHMVVNTDLW